MYEDAIDSILGDLQPGYTPGQARVNALRGNQPGSFATGMGAPPGGPSPMAPVPQMPPPQMPMQPPPTRTALPQAMGRPGTPTPPGPVGAPGGPPGGPGGPVPQPTNAPDPLMADYQDIQRREQQAMAEQQRMMQPPDRTAMEQAYQKNSNAGLGKLTLALAAQQAGPGFEPFQQQALQQYAASQAPQKMAGGTMTGEGFIEDPAYGQEVKLKQIEARITALGKAREGNLTMQEHRRLALLQEQEKQRHDETLKVIAGIHAAAAGQGRGDAAAQRQQATDWRTEDSLSKQFDAQTKNYVTELDATTKLGQLKPNARPNAVEQQSMVILLNKFLDPTSVVREGEFNRVIAAQGLLPRVQNYLDRVIKGEPLSDQMIADIRGMGKMYEQAARGKIQSIGDEYSAKATRRGLDPTSVIVSPYYQHTRTAAPQSGASASNAVRVNTPADAAKLPPGTAFITPDGQRRVRQ